MDQEEIDKLFREITNKIDMPKRHSAFWQVVLTIGLTLAVCALAGWLLTLTSMVVRD